MILGAPTKDATFFALVHSMLEAERSRDLRERRSGRRHPYVCLKRIAPLYGGKLPETSEFRQVQCVDLSPSGLAYLADELPTSAQMVVVLTTEPLIFLTADVVRREEIVHDSHPMYRVACRFSGRIDGDAQAPN